MLAWSPYRNFESQIFELYSSRPKNIILQNKLNLERETTSKSEK